MAAPHTTPTTCTADLVLRGGRAGTTNANALTVPVDILGREGPQPDPTNGIFVWGPSWSGEIGIPLLKGADDSTGRLRFYWWKMFQDLAKPELFQWVPFPLGQFKVTACTKTGVASGIIDATWRYCDIIEVEADRTPSPGIRVMQNTGSPDNEAAGFLLDHLGAGRLMCRASVNGLTATAINLLSTPINSG